VAAVAGEVGGGQALQQGAMRRVQVAQSDQVVGQRAGLVLGPGVEGGHQRRPIDQAGLEGQQAQEKMAGCIPGVISRLRPPTRPRRAAANPARVGSASSSRSICASDAMMWKKKRPARETPPVLFLATWDWADSDV